MTTSRADHLGFTLTASGDANTWQYHFVKGATTAGRFDLATGGSGPAPIGVLQNDPRSGEAGNIVAFGGTQVRANGATAIAYMDWITSGSDGLAVVTTDGSAVQGFALEALASGACVLIDVFLAPWFSYQADNTP